MGGIKSKDISITAMETPDHKLNWKYQATFPKWKQFTYHPQYRRELLHGRSCITSVHHWKQRNISQTLPLGKTLGCQPDFGRVCYEKTKSFPFWSGYFVIVIGPRIPGKGGGEEFCPFISSRSVACDGDSHTTTNAMSAEDSCDSFPSFSLPPQR